MTDLNHVAVIGRVTRDLDGKAFAYLPNGTARANVGIAVNRSRKGADGQWADETSFFDVTIWGKTAENLKQYLVKGQQIAVDGFLKQDRWERDGQKFSRVAIVANSVQLCGGRGNGGGQSHQGKPTFKPIPQAAQQGYLPDYGSMGPDGVDDDGFPEDIPF